DDQRLDSIEAVQFAAFGRHLGQIPTHRWGTATDAGLSVQGPGPAEDAVDRPDGGKSRELPGRQDLVDRLGAVESQIAGLLQLLAHGQDLILYRGGGAWRMTRGAPAVVPGDAIESLALSVPDPVMDGGGAHAE